MVRLLVATLGLVVVVSTVILSSLVSERSARACPLCGPPTRLAEAASLTGMLVDMSKLSQRPAGGTDNSRNLPEQWRLIRLGKSPLTLTLPSSNAELLEQAREHDGGYVRIHGALERSANLMQLERLEATEPVTFELTGNLYNFDIGFDEPSRPGLVFQTQGEESREYAIASSEADLQRWLEQRDDNLGSGAPSPRVTIQAHFTVRHRQGFSELAGEVIAWGEIALHITTVEAAATEGECEPACECEACECEACEAN